MRVVVKSPATGTSDRTTTRPQPRASRQRGVVTAETAMVLPLLAMVALGLGWLLALAATQVRVVDAARETARAAARDDGETSAVALGHRVAPEGAGGGR